jgi:hypothetical protein
MQRLSYFPRLLGDQPEWYQNFGDHVVAETAALPLDAALAADRAEDAKYLAYATGVWLTQVRAFSAAASAAIGVLQGGSGAAAYTLPGFTPPVLPAGVAPVPPGAHDRIAFFVQDIKNAAGYNADIGQTLRIIGSEAPPPPPVPAFSLFMLMGGLCQCVEIRFRKHGYPGVFIQSRRGPGDWEDLGIDMKTPFLDERPLLSASVPEIREYRLRFWDGTPIGDWSPVQRTTVAPS